MDLSKLAPKTNNNRYHVLIRRRIQSRCVLSLCHGIDGNTMDRIRNDFLSALAVPITALLQ
jgi:hypothetical protein